MKKEHLLELVIPHAVNALLSVAAVVLAAETLKKVCRVHHDLELVKEKHGLLKLAEHLHEERKREEKK